MTGLFGPLATVCFLLMSGWVIAQLLMPYALRFTGEQLHHRAMRRRLWRVALLPWLLPASLVVAAMLLAWAKQLGWIHDHCTEHLPHHPHFCLEHLPDFLPGYPQVFVLAIVFGLVLNRGISLAVGSFRQSRKVKALSGLSTGSGPVKRLDDERPLAFVGGLLQPRIFLSQGLAAQLDKRQQRIVLAHEIAHLRNADMLLNTVFEWLLLLHLPQQARTLRLRWRTGMELHADEQVAERFPRSEVASVLLSLAHQNTRAPTSASATGGNTVLRIQRLLNPVPLDASRFFERLFWIVLAVIFGTAVGAHHALETMLGLLVGA